MAEPISQKQMEIYNFLKAYIEDKAYPPSVREICTAVSLKSTSTVHAHLKTLEKKGYIHRESTKTRALEIIEFTERKKELLEIPIVGNVTAGEPILAVENIEDTFQIPINYIKNSNKELFILKVSGNSMIEAGIHDGDLAIIEKTNVAENNDIVVALIDNEATIKRFFKEDNYYRLQPENSTMDPIIVTECSILGKLVGLYREY